ncbi:unnamed protein product [Closterium sp. Yama58-4]|nr:unnamed protein product [Closterium sp. Yama58-4]
MGNCISGCCGDKKPEETPEETPVKDEASTQKAETADAPQPPPHTPSSVKDHRPYQSAPHLKPRSVHPSEVVPVDPSPPPTQPSAEELPCAPTASSGERSSGERDRSEEQGVAAVPPRSAEDSSSAAAAYYDKSRSRDYYNSNYVPQAVQDSFDYAAAAAAATAASPRPSAAKVVADISAAISSADTEPSSNSAQLNSITCTHGSLSDSADASASASASARMSADLPPLREFSYAELRAATGGFAPAHEIGKGGFGTVYRGRMMLPAGDGGEMVEREVAVKETNGKQFTERDMKSFKAEVAAMSALNHPNILRLEGVAFSAEQRPVLVYELIPGGDVFNLLRRVRRNEARFPWKDRVKVALGCAEALAIIHENKFIHRDFKSMNVLLRLDRTPVVADFGLAHTIEDWQTHVSMTVAGSWGYVDPHYLETGHLCQNADTYAFGVFLLELVSGYQPVEEEYKEKKKEVSPKDFNKPSLVADPTMEGEWEKKHVLQILAMVRCATLTKPHDRPAMGQLVAVLQHNSAQPPPTFGTHQFPAATIPPYTPSPVSPYRACHSAPIRGATPHHFSAIVPVSPSPPPAQFPRNTSTPPPPSSFPPSPSANRNNGSSASPSASPSLRANAFYDSAYHASASASTSSAEPLPPAMISTGSSASQSAGSSAGSSRGGNSSASPSAVPVLREFSFADLHAATGGFARAIGEGGFGKVYHGRMVLPAGGSSSIGGSSRVAMGAACGEMMECDVAVKVMNGKNVTRDFMSFKAEVAAMSAVNHPNILRLEGVALDTSQGPMLVYELIPGGDVKNLLKQVHNSGIHFPWRHRMKVALGCAEALATIHEHQFVHRDFKSSNVLLREDFTPVVADFGLARTIEDWKTHVSTKVVGSMGYIDPIYLQTGQLSQKSDTFAFGVFLLELISSCNPLNAKYQYLRQLIG